jgi:hypothetical protein
MKALDPDRIRIRIVLQPQTLDPDPEKNEYGSTTLNETVACIIQHIITWHAALQIPVYVSSKPSHSLRSFRIKNKFPALLKKRRSLKNFNFRAFFWQFFFTSINMDIFLSSKKFSSTGYLSPCFTLFVFLVIVTFHHSCAQTSAGVGHC